MSIRDEGTGIVRQLGFEEGTFHWDLTIDEIQAAIIAANVPNLSVTRISDIKLKLTSTTSIISVSKGLGPAIERLFFTNKNGFETHKIDTSKVTIDTVITDLNTGITKEDFIASKTADGNLKLEYNGSSLQIEGTGLAGLGITAQTQSVVASSVTRHELEDGDIIVLKDVKKLDGSDAEIDGGYVVGSLSSTYIFNVKITNGNIIITNKNTNGLTALSNTDSIALYDIVSADRDYIKEITLDIVQPITPIQVKLGDSVDDDSLLTSLVSAVGKYYGTEKLFSVPSGNVALKTVAGGDFSSGEFNLSFTITKKGKFTIPIAVEEELQSTSNIQWWSKRNFITTADAFFNAKNNQARYAIDDMVWVDNKPNGWVVSTLLDNKNHFGIDTATITAGGTGYGTADIGATLSYPTDISNTVTNPEITIGSIAYTVTKIDMTNSGVGYTSPPTVTITGGTPDTPAIGQAIISSTVTDIAITDSGGGYKAVPATTISSSDVYSGTSWNVAHNLGQRYLNVEIGNATDSTAHITKYESPTITFVDNNNLTVTWSTITTGTIDIVKSEAVSTLFTASNEWAFAHNLGDANPPNIDIIYDDNTVATGRYDHPIIEQVDANNVKVIFPTGVDKSGYIAASYSSNNISSSSGATQSFGSQKTWTITHNLNKQVCNVDIWVLGDVIDSSGFSTSFDSAKYYNIKSNYNYPTITYVDANTITATFDVATAGKMVVSSGAGNEDTSSTLTPHMAVDVDSPSGGCPGFIIANGGNSYTVGDVITVLGGTKSVSASASVATVSGGVVTGLTFINGGDYTVLPATTGCTTEGGTGTALTVDLNFKVVSMDIIEPGTFQITPEIIIEKPAQAPGNPVGCTPTRATATATLAGIIDHVQIMSAGTGYVTQPTIGFTGGGGAGAAGTVTITGPVKTINVSNIGDITLLPVTTNVATTGSTTGTGLQVTAIYKDITSFSTWFKTYRAEENGTHSTLFDIAKLYNKVEHSVDAKMQLIDPPKGIISGLADTEIQYKLERDPARYTHSSDDSFLTDTDETWGAKQVGQIWWDISKVRFINAELGDNRYRRENWGTVFPGSTIDIYEWVSDTVSPSQYKGTGIVKDENTYCEIAVWNDNLNMFITTYFFWVKDVRDIPNVDFRARSAVDVKNYITSPTKQGINWYAPISHNYEWTEEIIIANTSKTQTISRTVLPLEISRITINGVTVKWSQGTADADGKINTIKLITAPVVNDSLRVGYKRNGAALIINNIDHLLTVDDSVLQLRYNTKPTESNIHKQWKLIRPNDPRSNIPPQFINKFIDSITGYDKTGLAVPDTTILNDIEKHGTLSRPRQTWFKHVKTARQEFHKFINDKIKPLALDDERIGWDTDISTQTLLANEDWYSVKESTTSDAGIVTNVYYDHHTIVNYTVATVAERDALTNLKADDVVKVTNAGNNRWKLYKFTTWASLQVWTVIGSEKATRQLQAIAYTSDLTVAQTTELRQIINAIFNNVFIKEWFVYKNEVIFNMINYVLAEQPEVDWIFKSTYATTTVTESDITQKDKWKVDLLPSTQEFLNEAKPYSTKMREVTGIKSIKLETGKTHSTDFDNPPYKDTLGIFGTTGAIIPLQSSTADHLPTLQSGIYSDYFANRTDATKVRAVTVKMHFDRIHPLMEQPKTYTSGVTTIAGVDSRPVRRTVIKTEREREIALLNDIVNASAVGESSATQIGGSLHRVLKYSPSKGKIANIVKSLIDSRITVDTDIASHQIMITNGLQDSTTGLTYSNLTSITDTTDSYYTGQGLTIVEAMERYDYDINSALRAGTIGGLYPTPGPNSEALNKVKSFINRYENGLDSLREKLYDVDGIFNDIKKLQPEDSNRFTVAEEPGDAWGWDSDKWDSHDYSASEGADIPLRKWDDGGLQNNHYSEFKNYSLEKDITGDRVAWHVYDSTSRTGIETIKYSTKYIYVEASGIPDHEYGPFPNANNPNKVKNQNAFWKIPLEVVVPITADKEITPLGQIAIARNGVAIFNPKSSSTYLNEEVWHENAVTTETGIDSVNGHADTTNQYHYHQNPKAMYDDSSYAHSPLLGYAFDGVPIYGPRSFAEINGTGEIRRMRSSYRLKSGARVAIGSESVPAGNYDGTYIEDYEYVIGLGDLDEFNGRTAITPEYPEGIYAYYVTVDDLGDSAYPYIIGTKYYGKPLIDNYTNTQKPLITEAIPTQDVYLGNVATDRNDRDSKGFIRPQHEQHPEEFIPVNPKEGLQIITETRSNGVKIHDASATRLASAYVTVVGGAVTAVTITDGGAGYTNAGTTVNFHASKISASHPEPAGATATVTITAGAITAVTITAGGTNYSDINVSWKQYFDADGEKRIYALSDAQKTTLASNLISGVTEIAVTDVSKLPQPVKDTYLSGYAVPGVIFIGNERIEYFDVDHSNNKLLNCRRGTVTTTDENHSSGTKIYGITERNTLTGNYETMWDPHSGVDGKGILNSSSHEARFLRDNAGAAVT